MRTTARIGCGDSVEATRSITPAASTNAADPVTGSRPGRDELGLDLPSGVDGFADELAALDDERAVVGTRTAAPEQAPQPLDLGVAERQRFVQSAALADATSDANAAASVTARSARILRSTSMPAALSPAMNRL